MTHAIILYIENIEAPFLHTYIVTLRGAHLTEI